MTCQTTLNQLASFVCYICRGDAYVCVLTMGLGKKLFKLLEEDRAGRGFFS